VENERRGADIDLQRGSCESLNMNSISSALYIHADLACELDGSPFSIRCANRVFVVEVPDVATGLKLIQLGSSRGLPWRRVHRIKRLLDVICSSLEFKVAGKTVGSIGYEVGSHWWTLVGLPRLNLKLTRFLALFIHSRGI
jgi:hypothetical protein